MTDPETTETPDGAGATDGNATNDPTVAALAQRAALAVVKSVVSLVDTTGNGATDAGDTVTYAFAVTNTGTVALARVRVNDPLATVAGGPVTLGVGAIDAATFTATAVLTQADVDRGYVENSATATDDAVTEGGALS